MRRWRYRFSVGDRVKLRPGYWVGSGGYIVLHDDPMVILAESSLREYWASRGFTRGPRPLNRPGWELGYHVLHGDGSIGWANDQSLVRA
jgi:hypothetical protein